MLQASLACVKDKLRKVDAALVVLQLLLYAIVFAHRMQFIRSVLIKCLYWSEYSAPLLLQLKYANGRKLYVVFLVFYMVVLTKYWLKVVLGNLSFMYFYSSVCLLD